MRHSRLFPVPFSLVTLCLLLALCDVAGATSYTWDITPGTVGVGNGSVTGGAGTWNTTNGNWTTDSGANNVAWPATGTDNDAVFGGTAGAVAIAAGGVTANDLTFSTTGYSVTTNGLTLNGTTPTITAATGVSTIISSTLAGSAGMTKTGAGTLTLSGNNSSFTGTKTVNSGILVIGHANALGTGSVAVTGTTLGTAQLQLSGGISTPSGLSLTLSGTDTSNRAFLASLGSTNTWGGAIDLSGNNIELNNGGNQQLTVNGNITSSTNTGFTVRGNAGLNTTINGTISIGTGGVAVNDGSVLVINKSGNTWGNTTFFGTGATTIRLGAAGALPNSTNVDFASLSGGGGTLDLNGFSQTINGLTRTGVGSGTVSDRVGGGSGAVTFTIGNNDASGAFGGTIVNGNSTLTLKKEGLGTQTLAGANSYSGGTTVNAGTLQIGSGGTTGSIGSGTLQIGNGGNVILNRSDVSTVSNTVTGTGNFTLAATSLSDALTGNWSAFAGTVTIESGARWQSDAGTSTSANADWIVDGILSGNTTGGWTASFGSLSGSGSIFAGGSFSQINVIVGGSANDGTFSGTMNGGSNGVGTFTKVAANTQTLSGANAYTGKTSIQNGILSVNTIKDISGGNSSLGAPTTPTNGTIDIGSGANTGQLTYTGTAQATNRVINLAGTTGGVILDQSGAGLLEFTSNLTATGVGAKTLTLQGSTSGAGQISGQIVDGSGTTSLTKSGTGTWTLAGSNTYTGATNVSAGVLNIQHANALGGTGNGTTVSSGATLQIQGTITTAAEPLSLSGNGASGQSGALVNVGGTNNYAGLVALATASAVSSDSGILNLTNVGTITGSGLGLTLTGAGNGSVASIIGTGSGKLTKSGSGAWTLSGANLYTGITQVLEGVLRLGASGVISDASSVSFNPTTSATLDLDGNSEAIDGLNTGLNGGSSFVDNMGGAAAVLTVGSANGTGNFAGVIQNSGAALGLNKAGTGTQTLSGTNTYTGPTNVTGGKLSINGDNSAATGNVNVSAGATLEGTGIVGGDTFISGTDSPGNSPGLQPFAGDLTYNAGSNVVWELIANGNSGLGTNFDSISVGADLDFAGATTLDLDFDNSSAVLWSDPFWGSSQTGTNGWLLYDVAGSTSGYPANLSINPIDWLDSGAVALSTARPGSSFSLYKIGNDIYVNYSIAAAGVPEPGAFVLGLISLAGMGLLTWRKRLAGTPHEVRAANQPG